MVEKPYDAFLFLDQGARLFSHLIRERWHYLFPDDEIPDTYFVKIGREMGLPSQDPEQPVYYEYPRKINSPDWDGENPSIRTMVDRFKVNRRYSKLVKKLRNSFPIKNGQASFDDKNVLIVDEFMASGATLRYSKKLFSAAFKNIEVDGAGLIVRTFSKSDSGFPEDMNPSIINPVPGSKIPSSLGDMSRRGVVLPRPSSTEPVDKFFIEPQYMSPLEERMKELEKDMAITEEKLKKVPKEQMVTRKETKDAIHYIRHPILEKSFHLKNELSKIKEGHSNLQKRADRYHKARKEIRSIAES
jgi:hypothetical protein